MSSLHEELNQVPWAQLSHAYGAATDTPSHLLALLSQDDKEREKALSRLWASICHQGSVYEASGEAARALIHILQMVPDKQKPDILDLLSGLANGYRYSNRDQVILTMDHSSGGNRGQYWHSTQQFLREGNNYHQPQWMQRTHRFVGEGLPVYLALLQSTTDQDTVRETLSLLSCFRELNSSIVPVVTKLFEGATDPHAKVWALDCLSTLLDPQSPHWAYYQQLVNIDPTQVDPKVRSAAAYALARYHREDIPPAVVDILVEEMLQPYSINLTEDEDSASDREEAEMYSYSIDCRSLSCLGLPLGLQGLMRALDQGASRWSILNTMRVAEALLDVAFFGCWVENRYWEYRASRLSSVVKTAITISEGVEPDDDFPPSEALSDQDAEHNSFLFKYNVIGVTVDREGVVSYVNEHFIRVFGYDESEAAKLWQRYEQEGSRVLLAHQRDALHAVLRCEPLWKYPHNLLEIYGLPTSRDGVERFLLT